MPNQNLQNALNKRMKTEKTAAFFSGLLLIYVMVLFVLTLIIAFFKEDFISAGSYPLILLPGLLITIFCLITWRSAKKAEYKVRFAMEAQQKQQPSTVDALKKDASKKKEAFLAFLKKNKKNLLVIGAAILSLRAVVSVRSSMDRKSMMRMLNTRM